MARVLQQKIIEKARIAGNEPALWTCANLKS
jgi:hypothetical protein